MNPKRISVKKYNFKNNENNKEEKSISRYIFQKKNKINIYNKVNDNKQIKFNFLKNNEIQKEYHQEEDDYISEIYNKPVYKFKYFQHEAEDDFKYNTISYFNSLEIKNKYLLIFNQSKKDKYITEKDDMETAFSHLNLSFEVDWKNMKNNIFKKTKRKVVDKNLNFFDKIINVFAKNHKKMKIKHYNYNNKSNKSKLKFLNKNKNRINYYNSNNNYIKIQKNSKFSKKNKSRSLRKNYSRMDSDLNVYSQNFNEANEKQIIIPHPIHEINNKLSTTEKKIFHKIEYKNQNSFKNNKNANSIKSVTKNLFNANPSPNQSTSSKSNQIKYEDEIEENKKIKNTNIYIGLNKRNILNTNKNETDKNSNNNNQNGKIFFKYSNRKSNSINTDTSININNKNNDTSINESIIKKDKDKKEYMEKQPLKNIYKKYENLKRIKEEKEKEKEKEREKVKDYNTNITNKRYKKIINTNINNHNNNRRKENKNLQKNENNKNNDMQIDINKNNNRFINQNSNRKGNISNISLASQNGTNQNIPLMNKRRHIPVSINEKYDVALNNNNYKTNYINNNIDKNQQNKMEFTKIQFGNSVFHSSQISSHNVLSQSKNNFTQSYKNILPNNDKDNIKDKEIYPEKNYNKNIKIVRNKNVEQNKEKLISSRSCVLKSEINQDNNTNNNNNNDKSQKFSIIEKHKKNVEQNKNKEIKADKQIMAKRAYIYKIEEEKSNKDNKTTNQNSYFIANMLKSNGEEKNMSINNKIDNNTNNNKLNKEYKEKKQTNIIYIQQDKHINKFQRSNHKYHEIKSTSSDRIVKVEENDEINENNNQKQNKELFRYKINKKSNYILNSTSMDDIRGRRRKNNIES